MARPDRPPSPSDHSFEMRTYSRRGHDEESDREHQQGLLSGSTTRSPPGGDHHYPHGYESSDDRDSARHGQDPEQVSLLRSSEESSSSTSLRYSGDNRDGDRDDGDARTRQPMPLTGRPSVLAITLAASALILTLDVVASVPTAPRMVIFEDIICRNYYASARDGGAGDGGIGNCKIEPVQSELALINGWKETFDTIPGLIVSVPYGALANRIGRSKVLMLALIGCVFSEVWLAIVCALPRILPLRMVWMSGMFQLFGGGGATVMSMCFTMIADACSVEQRTTAFSRVHAAVLLSELVSIPIGAALISIDPWIPIIAVLVFSATIAVVACFVTLKYGKYIDSNAKTGPTSVESDDDSLNLSSSTPGKRKVWNRWNEATSSLVAAVSPWLNRNVLLILIAFFFCQLSRQFSSVLIQYCSYKFNWDYAQASYLLPLRASINLVVLFTILPSLTHFFVKKRGFREPQSDKYITMISGVSLVCGSLLIFLAAQPWTLVAGQIFIALGFAFTVTARSFLTAMVDPRYLSLLYTSVTTVTYAGFIVGGPMLAGAFQWGLQLGTLWVGMPFLVTTVLFAIATLAVAAARSLR